MNSFLIIFIICLAILIIFSVAVVIFTKKDKESGDNKFIDGVGHNIYYDRWLKRHKKTIK